MSQSWDSKTGRKIETPLAVSQFFFEIDRVCKAFNLSISHEDGHGAFVIENYNEGNINWLKAAQLELDED